MFYVPASCFLGAEAAFQLCQLDAADDEPIDIDDFRLFDSPEGVEKWRKETSRGPVKHTQVT